MTIAGQSGRRVTARQPFSEMVMASEKSGGDPFGTHRSTSPTGVLPQQAEVLDASLPAYDNELLLDVDTLNIDAASFRQLKDAAGGDEKKLADSIVNIVAKRGKMHNPVTGSGGMLIGRLRA